MKTYTKEEKARLLSEKEYQPDMELFSKSNIRKLSIDDLENISNFDNVEQFQNYCKENSNFPSEVIIDFELYIMESYDYDGKEVTFVSIDANKRLIAETNNRYAEKNSFKDLSIEVVEGLDYVRNDISYASIKHLSKNRGAGLDVDSNL